MYSSFISIQILSSQTIWFIHCFLQCFVSIFFQIILMPLKLCTFNCRGIQDHVKRRKIFHYLRVIDCDIIFLQETHSSVNDEKMWKSQWGETHLVFKWFF